MYYLAEGQAEVVIMGTADAATKQGVPATLLQTLHEQAVNCPSEQNRSSDGVIGKKGITLWCAYSDRRGRRVHGAYCEAFCVCKL